MSSVAAFGPQAASRLLLAVAIGALSTAGAGVGVATLLSGSPSPSVWIATYQHSTECRQAGAPQDPSCSAAAVQAATEQKLADSLERKARDLASRDQGSTGAANQQGPDPAVRAAAPAAPPTPGAVAHSDDGSSAGLDD